MIKLFWNTHNLKKTITDDKDIKKKKQLSLNGVFIIKNIQMFGFMKY